MRQTPAPVTVFGILNLAFGGLGLCGTLVAVVMFAMPDPSAEMQDPFFEQNPVFEKMTTSPLYDAWTKVSTGLGFVASVVLMIAGVGLLQVKPWGRNLSIGYALYGIVMGVVTGVVNYFMIIQPVLEQMGQAGQGPQQAAMVGGAVGGMFGVCLALIYPVLLLIFMLLPNVKAAFQTPIDDVSNPIHGQ